MFYFYNFFAVNLSKWLFYVNNEFCFLFILNMTQSLQLKGAITLSAASAVEEGLVSEAVSLILLVLLCKLKDTLKGPRGNAWKVLVTITNHGKCLARTSLAICKDADIVAIYCWLDKILENKTRAWHKCDGCLSNGSLLCINHDSNWPVQTCLAVYPILWQIPLCKNPISPHLI